MPLNNRTSYQRRQDAFFHSRNDIPTSDEFSAEEFGASVGNTPAANATAIQAATAAASGRGGGIVTFGSGIYQYDTAIACADNVGYQGRGKVATVLQMTETDQDGFTGTDLQFVTWENLLLDGPNSGTGKGINVTYDGTGGIFPFYLRMVNCMVREWGSDGVYIEDPVMCSFTDCTSKENGSQGFYIASDTLGGTSTTFTSCYGHDNTGSGFRVDSQAYLAFVGCGADSSTAGHGYKLEGCTGFSLNGCGAEGNNFAGWQITSSCKNGVLNGCYSNDPGQRAFQVAGTSTDIVFIGCVQGGTVTTGTEFIEVQAGCTATVIACDEGGTLVNDFTGTVSELS